MTLLIIGVAGWSLIHLMPAIAPGFRKTLVDRLGEKPYRGVFALAIAASLLVIVFGWRSTPDTYVYVLPAWSRTANFVLAILGFVLIGASHYATGIKRVIRHPMLTGVACWAAGHLLGNGTERALVLFGGLAVWAILEIVLINRREPAYEKPAAPGFSAELRGLFISAIIIIVVMFLHPWIAGVRLLNFG